MNEVVQAKKSVPSTVLLAVFMAVGLVFIVLMVRTFEARLAAANEAREAEYAAEYAEFEAANPVEDAAVEGEVVPAEDAAPVE